MKDATGSHLTLTVRAYNAADGVAFHDLNLEWIKKYFRVEASDRAQLEDPETNILAIGGRILIADLQGQPVGTVALLPGHGENTVELAKMSVRPNVHGQGIGKALMVAAIETAREMGAKHIWLETNTVLLPALKLYRKYGFRELVGDELTATPYDRCNCQMKLDL